MGQSSVDRKHAILNQEGNDILCFLGGNVGHHGKADNTNDETAGPHDATNPGGVQSQFALGVQVTAGVASANENMGEHDGVTDK